MIPLDLNIRRLVAVAVSLVNVTKHSAEPLLAIFLYNFQAFWVCNLDVGRPGLFGNPVTFVKFNYTFVFRHS